jgi:predicted nucleotidyltransferase
MSHLSERLSSDEVKAVEAFVEQLLTEFGQDVTDVRLFGSKARGEAGPDSDLDILVLVRRPDYALKHAILWLAAEVSLAQDVLLSPRVVPLTAWQKMVEADTLFYRTVCAEGIPFTVAAQAARKLLAQTGP